MKHEIFIKCNVHIAEDTLKEKIASFITLPFTIKQTLRPDTLAKLKNKIISSVNNKNLKILEDSFHMYLPSSIPEVVIETLVNKIATLSKVSLVRYNGVTQGSSVFPALANAPEDNPGFFEQQHHFISPLGVDSMYGWTLPGGDGKGINVFITDTEVTEDDDIKFEIVGEYSVPKGTHGTNVAGLIAALNNDSAVIGIVPEASVYISWFGDYEGIFEIGKAGDIVNHSIGYKISGFNYPWPIYDENIAKIQLASELGITTCYCSANGNVNLDTLTDSDKHFMDRNSEDFIDNTGICVGGASILNKVTPSRQYNYGSIVDVFAQSSNTYTIFGGFSGTSASTPIISGLAAQIQSIMKAHGKEPLTPKELRSLLSDPALGIKGEGAHDTDNAVMPDMRKIMSYLNIIPENDYPQDYGLTNEEKELIDDAIDSLFLDKEHTILKPNITLQEILAIQSQVFQAKPSIHKLNALKDVDKAIEIYNELNGGELIDNYNFARQGENWIIYSTSTEFVDNGVILSGANARGVLGVSYSIPLSFNSTLTGMKVSSKIEILEWSDANKAEVILGHYAPGLDAILSYNLYSKMESTNEIIDISFIVTSQVSTNNLFPSVGVKGAKKILIKEVSIKPNQEN